MIVPERAPVDGRHHLPAFATAWRVKVRHTSLVGARREQPDGRPLACGTRLKVGGGEPYPPVRPLASYGSAAVARLGIDEYLTRTDAAGPSHFLTDPLGTTIGLADSSAVQTEYTYEPFVVITSAGKVECVGGPCYYLGSSVLKTAPDETWIPPANVPPLSDARPIAGCKPEPPKSSK